VRVSFIAAVDDSRKIPSRAPTLALEVLAPVSEIPKPAVTESDAVYAVLPVPAVGGVPATETVEVTTPLETDVESKKVINGLTFEPVGFVPTGRNETEIESRFPAVSSDATEMIAAVAVSPVPVAGVKLAVPFCTTASEIGPAAACDGTTERTPKPNAATATSAMRLNVVFVDMCFLSIVDPRTIRRSA
jgi:hypothetical protein